MTAQENMAMSDLAPILNLLHPQVRAIQRRQQVADALQVSLLEESQARTRYYDALTQKMEAETFLIWVEARIKVAELKGNPPQPPMGFNSN